MAHPSMDINTYYQYFENIARYHTAIAHTDTAKHFMRFNLHEITSSMKSGIVDPVLAVELFDTDILDAKSDNVQSLKTGAFTVLYKVERDNWDAEVAAIHNASVIGKQILARMYYDADIQRPGHVFAQLRLDEASGQKVQSLYNGQYFGWRWQFTFVNRAGELDYDPADWSDDPTSGIMLDISALSCANINHATNGLSTTQRLTCVLPQYDFSDPATQAATTAQQQTDLTTWLGGGSPVSIFETDGLTHVSGSPVASGGTLTLQGATVVDQLANVLATLEDADSYEVTAASEIDSITATGTNEVISVTP